MELPSWHISVGQHPSPATVISLSLTQQPAQAFSPISTFPVQAPSPFIWSLLSEHILYFATKLDDGGDKGSDPGTGSGDITSPAVCLSLIFTPVGSQTVTSASHEGCCDFLSLNTVCWQLVSRTLPTWQWPQLPPRAVGAVYQRNNKNGKRKKTSSFTYKCFGWLIKSHTILCPLFSPFTSAWM